MATTTIEGGDAMTGTESCVCAGTVGTASLSQHSDAAFPIVVGDGLGASAGQQHETRTAEPQSIKERPCAPADTSNAGASSAATTVL